MTLSKHCIPFLHKSCRKLWPSMCSRLVSATIATAEWGQTEDYDAEVKANSSGNSGLFCVAVFTDKVRVSVPCEFIKASYLQDDGLQDGVSAGPGCEHMVYLPTPGTDGEQV